MSNWIDLDASGLLRLLEAEEVEPQQIIDVRELAEWQYYHIPSSTHIPMNSIPHAIGRLPEDKPVYIICAHGVRSAAVCDYLAEQGITGLHNVTGGMAAYAMLQGFQYD
ncbi:rhodanese-like domain-containing protein [Paenibacillus protaetiae]|uniref:Rhodanese-like domain-containing protein n=1 Tax=Paenibacillus protaetiae TaxID=2509456 RepID=A0A4P6ETE9_9BACL|nr:rhodanese-like domain-containing protein [Paenibacillus protaetiae]QAY66192.1 rhodanese-like domain-containing protein [Paenibacillus protaetiae]